MADLLEDETDTDGAPLARTRTPMAPDILALTRIERTLAELPAADRARIVAWIAAKHQENGKA